MANVTVVGAQWGDEGKGKLVDWLSHRADVVARFQGGHNAGHTLVVGEKVYKLSLLPSGVVRGKLSVIGNGVVVDPWAFVSEVERIREQGVDITPDVVKISETAALILPIHRELDAMRENRDDGEAIGTTRRGIGPAYEDKVGRRAIRVVDLADEDALRARVADPAVGKGHEVAVPDLVVAEVVFRAAVDEHVRNHAVVRGAVVVVCAAAFFGLLRKKTKRERLHLPIASWP